MANRKPANRNVVQVAWSGPAKAPRHMASQPQQPTHRALRGYAFDPSLATSLDTAVVSEITYRVPWEKLERGPIGEYVEVVDYDPASQCFYAPVDLDHPFVLAEDGYGPSEGNPQFHQQMVYAVAMTTIDHFERALGRKAFWADRFEKGTHLSDDEQFVRRLRIYPHAMRMANAYYSRGKFSILCGYFPATEDRSTGQFPRGMVFTCLSHDIVAHETTHALLDGFHEYFLEATNPDVLAFHEAFADLVALFQHFTFPEIIAHQIAKTRGNLESDNLLAQLAAQFGLARGTHGALRDAIGRFDADKKWVRHVPDPTELDDTLEVHERGAILVAAIFDAFLAIYKGRTRDLVRLASGGTGVLQQGDLHPDLVNRLADEAAMAASHVLNMCIRALDYCPPVDLTFGEYLRALVTADMDLYPEDQRGYRVAFIEAFRRRGIYPEDIRTLSEDSLRWARPGEDPEREPGEVEGMLARFINDIKLRTHVDKLRYLKTRKEIWKETRQIRIDLHNFIQNAVVKAELLQRLTGLALAEYQAPEGVRVRRNGMPVFSVRSLREARRAREDGRALNQVFVTILQTETMEHEGQSHTIRCGSTLVIDLDESKVTYVIGKGLHDKARLLRNIKFKEAMENSPLAVTYYGEGKEPFAALHNISA
ncbi:hypothetical protein DSM104443_00553 [Usitatibacter rugosus]|uniref:Peptidase M4 n=1 Tax=Usitatibacter rugosus TaxID=2732067 RepID=A0A6M4GQ88_9PROT|nr:hypothetical protein [Usitatibacter rugosus]QJR09509.1 hypothetical protein DSM104443_00553 [Usitatibacter rugosus]